jgi:hypothetical protein
MGMVVAPPPDAFLDAIAEALKRRSKALKHKLKSIRVERTAAGIEQEEKLEIVCAHWEHGVRTTLQAWPGHFVMIDARKFQWNKGWLWQFRRAGRLVGHREGPAIIRLLEQTLPLASGMNPENVERYHRLWDPILANGPRLLAQRVNADP